MYLARNLEPVQPPAHVWAAIQRRLNFTTQSTALRRTRLFAGGERHADCRHGLASLLAQPSGHAGHRHVATISATSGTPVGIGNIRQSRSPGDASREASGTSGGIRDYELWALPKGGAPCRSGCCPH